MIVRQKPGLQTRKGPVLILSLILISGIFLAACTPVTPAEGDLPETEPGSGAAASPSPQETENPAPSPTQPTRDLPPGRELAPGAGIPLVPETPVIGEVPGDLLEKMYAFMETDLKLDRSQFTLVRAESVIWPDGSLGCPQPGVMYTMALVEGYWVQVLVGEQLVDFRASQNGKFQICQQGDFNLPIRPISTPNQ